MKLKIRYENEYQEVELDMEDMDKMCICLSIEATDLTDEEKEQRIQEVFEKDYNKPEYNIYHKETRHIDPTPKRRRMDGRKGYIQGDPYDDSFNIMDYLVTTEDVDAHEEIDMEAEHKKTCSWVRQVLGKKTNWADAFIAIRIDGMSVNDYAKSIGVKDASIVSKWLTRAKKKLQEEYMKRQK